jgi:hypothetical protein
MYIRVSFRQGTAVYAPERSAMIWTIKSFPGGKVRKLHTVKSVPFS